MVLDRDVIAVARVVSVICFLALILGMFCFFLYMRPLGGVSLSLMIGSLLSGAISIPLGWPGLLDELPLTAPTKEPATSAGSF